MTKRAILIVPGIKKNAQNEVRDALVDAVVAYSEGYAVDRSGEDTSGGLGFVEVQAKNRETDAPITLHIYEAYWSDLIPDWSRETPWRRFKRGFLLTFYWLLGGLAKSFWRREWPSRILFALFISATILVLWYASVIAIFITSMKASFPDTILDISKLLPSLHLESDINSIVNQLSALPVVIFLVGLAGTGHLEEISNIYSFAKSYLQDTPLQATGVGLRGQTRCRVRAVLDHVTAKEYDEIYVIGHSFGGAIAVDALAEYGHPLSRIVLLTWGSAMGVLVQQEPLIEREIEKFYTSPTQIANWVDVVFAGDFMGSKVPLPLSTQTKGKKTQARRHSRLFPETVTPKLPAGLIFSVERIHNGYFQCEEAILMLVAPMESLPAKRISASDPQNPLGVS